MDDEPAGFGARLRARREAAGLSPEELAQLSGLSLRTISNLERDRTRWPYRSTLQRLADGLALRDEDRTRFIAEIGRRPGQTVNGTVVSRRPRDNGLAVAPRQLPAAITGFAGRQRELTLLSQVLNQPGGTAVIAAVGGTAG
jgi:transcriptional regulator with XRE-family HTH domain